MPKFDIDQLTKILAVEMTARTGELWRAVLDADHWNHIESPTACLSLREDWRSHRLSIHATTPGKMRQRTTGETITCDPGRKAEAIARDIESRILAHARAHLIQSREYDAEQTREKNAEKLRGKMIQKYLPQEYQSGKYCSRKEASPYKQRVYAQPTYENLINIEVNLPLPEALKLLKQLTQDI